MKTIFIFGDSITWGAVDYEGGGWAQRLRRYLEVEDYSVEIFVLGVPGDTTEDLLKRFKSEVETRKPSSRPISFIFDIGTNDTRMTIGSPEIDMSSDKYRENLDQLVLEAKEYSQEMCFLDLAPCIEEKTTPTIWDENEYFTLERMGEFNTVLMEFCERENIPLITAYKNVTQQDLDPEDGVHPLTSGHIKVYEKVRDYLIENGKVEK